MALLGHRDIRMTLIYVQVTQQDLFREFHLARQSAMHLHHIPDISPLTTLPVSCDLSGIRRTLEATRHLLEMYRRRLQDQHARRKIQRLDKRLLSVAFELDRFGSAKK